MSSDATQNLLQNQHLVAILIYENVFFISCKPGLNFVIENRGFPAKLARIQPFFT